MSPTDKFFFEASPEDDLVLCVTGLEHTLCWGSETANGPQTCVLVHVQA